MVKRTAIATALVIAVGVAATAIAQPDFTPPPDPTEVAAEESAYGLCVADAAKAGAENPAEACAALRPGGGNGASGNDTSASANHDGAVSLNANGKSDETFAAQCAGENKEDGSFGECVSELASSFGQCVAVNAKNGVENPAAACTAEFPGRGQPGGDGTTGPPEGVTTGRPDGVPSGKPAGTPTGKPEGTPAGMPSGTPTGAPEGVPAGKPAGMPGGGPGS